MTEVGERIESKRKAMGLSQAEVAEKAGVSAAVVSKLESGKYPLNGSEAAAAVKRVLRVRAHRRGGARPTRSPAAATRTEALEGAVRALRLEVASLSIAVTKLHDIFNPLPVAETKAA